MTGTLYSNQLQNASGFDRTAIHYQISILHNCARATGRDGVLQLCVGRADKPEAGMLAHSFDIGDIDAMTDAAMGYDAVPQANVYLVWALMRRGITSGRGGEIDVVAPLAAVLDEDNDKGIRVHLPAKPSLTIESSAGNFQHIYIFNTPPADAKQMFAALHVAAGG